MLGEKGKKSKQCKWSKLKQESKLMKQVCYQTVLLTACKVFKYGVISCPNARKYRLEKTPYLDTFHAVAYSSNLL